MAPRKKPTTAANLTDGLVNVVANLGTGRDKAAHSTYTPALYNPVELLNMYRTSWVAAKIVDAPAEDATRKWRKWRAEADQIVKIEELEKRLNLHQLTQQALIAARLWGVSYLYINTQDKSQDQPLQPGKEIKSLVLLTRNELSANELVRDIDNPYYGKPEYYTLQTQGADQVQIHASRLVVLYGRVLPVGASFAFTECIGDSVLQSVRDAVVQYDSTMANMASLVFEAKVDLFKFKGWAELLADSRNDAMLARRLNMQAAMKGINGAVVVDAEDDYVSRSHSFGGLPEVVMKFMEQVSGASGAPVTRIFGRGAAGLSGSGDGDERAYYDRINHLQSNELSPAIALLDDCIIYQALGARLPEVYYEWRPLRQLTETDRADIFSKTASALRSLAGTSAGPVIPLDALSDSAVNEFVELGLLPGLEGAIAKYGSLNEQDDLEEEVPTDEIP